MAQRDLRRVKAAADRVEQAKAGLNRAMMLAQDSGETIRDIAPYAGLSISRVHELLRKARKANG